jgi:predicted Fe-Mo cluster-binding NifX family protein
MKIAVSSLGSSLDAWTGNPFGTCSQFLVIDTEDMSFVVISVPPEEIDPTRVSLAAIRALANHDVSCVITGKIKGICRETLINLGIEVVDGIERMAVRDAVETYLSSGATAVQSLESPAERIAVACHGDTMDDTLSPKGEPCTSFIVVAPETMTFEAVDVPPADSPVQASVNAVRAAARHGATVVITSQIRPACCTALRALAITVVLADEGLTVREAVQAYQRGELETPPYL